MATYKSIRYIVPVEAVEHTDSINALSDVDTNTTAPTDGQILKWNNTTSKWYPGDVEEVSSNATQKGIIAFGEDENGCTINFSFDFKYRCYSFSSKWCWNCKNRINCNRLWWR